MPLPTKPLAKTSSGHDIWEKRTTIIRGTQVLVAQAKNIKIVLGTSKGRDKICSIVQYGAKLLYTCHAHSNIPEVREAVKGLGPESIESLMSGRIYRSMSRNRKIFNLFKFVDEIYNILRISNDKSSALDIRFFKILTHFSAFWNFIFDNLVWMINTRIIAQEYFRRNVGGLQKMRYRACFWRNVFNLVVSVLEYRKTIK